MQHLLQRCQLRDERFRPKLLKPPFEICLYASSRLELVEPAFLFRADTNDNTWYWTDSVSRELERGADVDEGCDQCILYVLSNVSYSRVSLSWRLADLVQGI
jgi:hypothetical protein